jgi:hypothetical protein
LCPSRLGASIKSPWPEAMARGDQGQTLWITPAVGQRIHPMTEAPGAKKPSNGGLKIVYTVTGVAVGVLALVGTSVSVVNDQHRHELLDAHRGASIRLNAIEDHLVVDAERRFVEVEADVKEFGDKLNEISGDVKILLHRIPE